MNKRRLGTQYEEKAESYLRENGYRVLEKNFSYRGGEIDIIAQKGNYLCFIEVKYRSSNAYGTPLEAVDLRKQNTIKRTALYYFMKHHLNDGVPCRFDVIAFEGEKLIHLENAFQ